MRVSGERYKGKRKARKLRPGGERGQTRSTTQQHDDHVLDAEEYSWILGRAYEDPAISASAYGGKVRDGFEELIDDLRSDRFKAHVLMMWENSRGSRQVQEWVNLIDLCRLRSVYIWVSCEDRLYDPANPSDRKDLLHEAVDSEYESATTSRRTRRDAAASARAGRPHGPVTYGYRRVYDSDTGELITQEIVPEEAIHIAELFYRYVAGYPLYRIAHAWEERGIRSRSGKVFKEETLRTMLMSPTYAGLRGHAAGAKHGHTHYTEDQLHPGCWDAIVPERLWRDAQLRLRDPQRKATKPGAAKYLLSMMARCGKCGFPAAGVKRAGKWGYSCVKKGCVRVDLTALDRYVEAAILDYLGDADVVAALRAADAADTAEITRLRAEVVTLRKREREYVSEAAKGAINRAFAAQVAAEIAEAITKAEKQLNELNTPGVLRGLIEPGPGVAQRWAAAPLSARREIARIVLAPERLGALYIEPTVRRGRIPVPVHQRLTFRRPDPVNLAA